MADVISQTRTRTKRGDRLRPLLTVIAALDQIEDLSSPPAWGSCPSLI